MQKSDLAALAAAYITAETEPAFRAEVQKLLDRTKNDPSSAESAWKDLEDRFYRNLEFGTGGLRGLIGGGYNRMNTLVVKRATQGLASYLLKAFPSKTLSAAIAYDSRHYSPAFAASAALVFAANGIRAYLFSSPRPTPELSFAVRHLGCDTGIVVTASHNPRQYNGYKVYWNDGSQVIPPHDQGIIDEVNAVSTVRELDQNTALQQGLFVLMDTEIDGPYEEMVRRRLFRPELFKARAQEVKVVYTPLHGTGAERVEAVLGGLGLQVLTVPEQREGNGDFPTVASPNPEDAAALELALKLGIQEKADVVMATDPDADRLGIAVPDAGKDRFTLVTGNQLGVLLGDYLFRSLKETGTMPANPIMVNTIVTTGMQRLVAASYGVDCVECLTGFKWIAAIMRRCETDGQGRRVIYGTEESYGYLVEDEVRDKDGVSAAAMVAELTLYWQSQGKTLLHRLEELYALHGYWEETGLSKYFPGPDGPRVMQAIMEEYRKQPPKTLGGIEVEKVRDIQESRWVYPAEPARTEPVDLPKSDVLQFFLTDGTVVSARPSGTEPKIKFYASCRVDLGAAGLPGAKVEAARKLEAIKADLRRAIGE